MIALKDGRRELFQWDTGVSVEVLGECNEIHFANNPIGTTYNVKTKIEAGKSYAMIPDAFLQTSHPIRAYAYVANENGKFTKEEQIFKVKKRNKPNNYIYEQIDPADLANSLTILTGKDYSGYTYSELNEQVKNLVLLTPEQKKEIDAMATIRAIAKSVNIYNGNYGLWAKNPHTPDVSFKLPYLYTPNCPFYKGCFNSELIECGFDFTSGTFSEDNGALGNLKNLQKVTVTGVENKMWARAFESDSGLEEINIFDSIENENPASPTAEVLSAPTPDGFYFRMFFNCRNLTTVNAIFDFTNMCTKDLNLMFYSCNRLQNVRFKPLTLGKGDNTLQTSLSITSPELAYLKPDGVWNADSLVSLVNAVVPNRGIHLTLNAIFDYNSATPPLHLWMTPDDDVITDTTLYHAATQEEYNQGKARYFISILTLNKHADLSFTA